MRILVTGAAGMLGKAVVGRLQGDHSVVGVDLPDGDLSLPGVAASLVERHRAEWVIHCAAWTNVDGAETHRTEALAANGGATALLAGACEERSCGLTYISTDYVFDGEGPPEGYAEDHPRDPINYYGTTKAAGEKSVELMTAPWQIVRISWLFGDGPVNFPRTIRRLLGEKESLRVVDDQRGCPTYAPDLAEVLAFLVSGRHRGIFHGTNAGICTWYELACEVARLLGIDPARITPCSSDEYPTAARRPRCSVLRSTALEQVGCPARPAWQDALQRYLAGLDREPAA
jgi:dTDP-4-dehydrorhamnose reductase